MSGAMVVQAGSIGQVRMASGAWAGQRMVPPRQLPPAVRDFVGRDDQIAELDSLLPAAKADGGAAGAVVISAVDGLPGVGKTTLAVVWAHRVQDQFPDGTLYVDLRGYGPGEPASPGEVLGDFLRALDVLPERIPIGIEAQAGLYRSLLAGRRMLILLDNANSAAQVRPLLPGSRDCLVLVTSRDSLAGLVIGEGARRVTLHPLTPQEAVDLVGETIGQRRAEAEPQAVRELARLCDRLPLALRIAGGHIAARHYLGVAELVAEMVDDRGRLDVLSTSADEATAVRPVFGWSYRKLTGEQARLFRRLGLHPGPQVSVHAAAVVAELTEPQTRHLLDELAGVHLVEPAARERYRLHDLLRAYAIDRADHDDAVEDRDCAVRGLLDWYAFTAAAADRLVYPAYVHRFHDLDRPPGPLLVMTTRADAHAWLVRERANIVAAIRHATERDPASCAIPLVHTIETYLYHYAYWDELFEVCALGIAAAEHIGDTASQAWFLNRSGWARLQVSCWDDAMGDLHRALALAGALRDQYLEAYARNDLGMGFLRRNRYAEALEYLLPAISLSKGTDSGRQEAFVHCNVSSALAGLGDNRRALTHAEHSLRLRWQAEDYEGEVFTRNQLARVWQNLGDYGKAIAQCEEALDVPREYAYLPDIAATFDTLGTSLAHCGDTQRAEACWLEALDIYDKFGDQRSQKLRHRLRTLRSTDTAVE
jgi:tetratricopeptide (TPR) repeat protein